MRSGQEVESRETLGGDDAAGRVFDLRVGVRDPATGRILRRGVMRRATARDELAALADFRVFVDPEYILVALLAKVLSFDTVRKVSFPMIETLTIEDLDLLEDLYRQLNGYPLERGKGRVHAL